MTEGATSQDAPAAVHESACIGRASMGLGALVLLMFVDVLFGENMMIPSHPQGDTARYFLWMRLFGYAELGAGNIPLWNPHVFSGTPFVGVFQSAIFYPVNLFYLLTDVRTGLTIELALHSFLLGIFFFAWLRAKSITPLSAFVASACLMFGATVSLRVLAGQMTVLDTLAWWPLLMLAVDHLSRRVTQAWLLVGIGAMSMMMLTGHPPTAMMAGIATALYCLPILFRVRFRFRFVAALASLIVAPMLIGAVQLATGLQTAGESVRSEGMSYAFAVSHSFPPEQILTLLVPELFGDASAFNRSYFGRVFFWDATIYMGVIGLLLAIHGALAGRGRDRSASLGLGLVMGVLALGGYTPLYRILYEAVPLFQFVRAPSKFMFFAAAFAALLAAIGLDRLRADRNGVARSVIIAGALTALTAGLALWAALASDDPTAPHSPMRVFASLWGSGALTEGATEADWRAILARSAVVSTAFAGVGAVLIALAPGRRSVVYLIAALAIVEVFLFARVHRGHTRMVVELDLRPEAVVAYAKADGTRVLETAAASSIAMSRRNFALWGYDPVILGRYVDFMALTQGTDLGNLTTPTLQSIRRFHPLHAMMRGRYEIQSDTKAIIDHGPPLPRFFVVEDYTVVPGPEAALAAIAEPGFTARRSVILESPPNPAPARGASGEAKGPRISLLSQSSDHVELDAELQRAGILVLTSAYSSGWRALPLEGSVQDAYEVMPANYVARGIPLSAGHHRIRVEYSPLAYRIGARVSAFAALGFVLLVAHACTRGLVRSPSTRGA